MKFSFCSLLFQRTNAKKRDQFTVGMNLMELIKKIGSREYVMLEDYAAQEVKMQVIRQVHSKNAMDEKDRAADWLSLPVEFSITRLGLPKIKLLSEEPIDA